MKKIELLKGKFLLFILASVFLFTNLSATPYRDKVNYVKALMELGIYDTAEEKIQWMRKKYGDSMKLDYLEGKLKLKKGDIKQGRKILNKIHLKHPTFKRKEIRKTLGIQISKVKIPENLNLETIKKKARRENSFFAKLKQKIKDTGYYQVFGGVVVSFFLLPM